jgi:hypothetical protein
MKIKYSSILMTIPYSSTINTSVSTTMSDSALSNYQPLITSSTNLGDISVTTALSSKEGFYESGGQYQSQDIFQYGTINGSTQIQLYNGAIDFDSFFAIGDRVVIGGATSIGGIPTNEINGEHTVTGFYTHPIDNIEVGFFINSTSAATATENGTFATSATVSYGEQKFVYPSSDYLVHGGELYSYLQANYATTEPEINVENVDSTRLVTEGTLLDYVVNNVMPAHFNYTNGQIEAAISLSASETQQNFLQLENYPFTLDNNVIRTKPMVSLLVVPRIHYSNERSQAMSVQTFSAFKTTADEILADDISEPISCQALLESGSLALIQGILDPSGYHLLPPSGTVINTHLTTNYVSKLTDNVIIGSGATTGTNGVSIGKNAGQSAINSIVINATGLNLNNNQAGFYAAPIRNVDNTYNNVLRYDTVNKEIIYDTFTTSSSLTGREYTLEDSNNFNSINKPFPGRKTDSDPGKWHIVTSLNPGDAMNNPWNGSNSSLGKGSPSVLKPLQIVSNNSTGTDLIVKFEILMLDGTSHHFFYKNAVLKDLFNYKATTAGGTMNIYAFYQDNNGSVVDMAGLQSAWNGPFSFTANPPSNVWNWPFASSPSIGQAGAMDYDNPNGYGLLVHGGTSGGTNQEDAVAIYSGAIASGAAVQGWYQIRVYYWGE